jgi:hypothetical protein
MSNDRRDMASMEGRLWPLPACISVSCFIRISGFGFWAQGFGPGVSGFGLKI